VRRILAIAVVSTVASLAAVGLLGALWFIATPNESIVSWIGWR